MSKLQWSTPKNQCTHPHHSNLRRPVWGRTSSWRAPSPDSGYLSSTSSRIHDFSPTFHPSLWEFLKCPPSALSVGTLQLSRSCFQNRYSLLEMLNSEPVPGDTIWNKWSPSTTLRVTPVGKKSGWEISAQALLDSGAVRGSLWIMTYAIWNNLTLQTLVNPLPVKNVDGMSNKKGLVWYTTIQKIHIKTGEDKFHEETSELYVTTLGDHDIIFGTDWLHAHNPEVNWALPQIAFSRCPNLHLVQGTPGYDLKETTNISYIHQCAPTRGRQLLCPCGDTSSLDMSAEFLWVKGQWSMMLKFRWGQSSPTEIDV